MTQNLANKIALITGGSEGFGYATTELFVREGAFVYITGRRRQDKLGNTSVACGIQADAHQTWRILTKYTIELGTFGSITEATYDKLFNTNVKGVTSI